MLQNVVGRLVRRPPRQPAGRNVGLVVVINGGGGPLVLDDDQLVPGRGQRQGVDGAVHRPLVDGLTPEVVVDPQALQNGELLAVTGVQPAGQVQDLGLLLRY